MGLSRMSDELYFSRNGTSSMDQLYGHRGYIDPVYGSWQSWYAWYPVRRVLWGTGAAVWKVKLHRWEWRTNLLRRRVLSKHDHYSSQRKKAQWEYTTMEEALRWA